MTSLRSSLIRLAHEKIDLRPHLLPLLRKASEKPLTGHIGPETAYVVEDYPYGSYRTQMRYWLEKHPTRGFRMVSQSLNPKTKRWNNPKPSTYVPFAGSMFLDEKGHVQWDGVGTYDEGETVLKFIWRFPDADYSLLRPWALRKISYHSSLLKANEVGSSGWAINGVTQPATNQDIARNTKELDFWERILNLLPR